MLFAFLCIGLLYDTTTRLIIIPGECALKEFAPGPMLLLSVSPMRKRYTCLAWRIQKIGEEFTSRLRNGSKY